MRLPTVDWPELSLQVMITFGHFLWQGCAVAILLVIAEQAFAMVSGKTPTGSRRSANRQYTIACLAFFSLPVCVATTFAWVHQSRGPVLMAADATAESVTVPAAVASEPTSSVAIVGEPILPPMEIPAGPDASTSKPSESYLRIASPTSWTQRIESFAPFLLTTYLIVVACLLARFGVSMVGSSRLSRAIQPITDSQFADSQCATIIAEQSSRLGLRRIPVVALCQRVAVPVVVGIVKPMILLPPVLLCGLDPNQLAAILSHEMAHIRRYDPLVNLLQRIAESLLFFHPATWWISCRVSIERENCCDDMAAAGCGRMEYAAALLRMAEQCASARGLNVTPQMQALAADGGNISQLGHRIRRLLGEDHTPRVTLTWRAFTAFAFSTVFLGSTVIALAQSRGAAITQENGSDNQPVERSDSNEVQPKPNLTPTDQALSRQHAKAADYRRQHPGQSSSDITKDFDNAFDEWIEEFASSARHSVGWPQGELQKQKLSEQTIVTQVLDSRLAELTRLLENKASNEFDHAIAGTVAGGVANLVESELDGLSRSDQEKIDSQLSSVKSPMDLGRAIALSHTLLAKAQLVGREDLQSDLEELVVTIGKNLEKPSATTSQDGLVEALFAMKKRLVTRMENLTQELQLRTVTEELVNDLPAIRSYLVAKQAREGINTQVAISEKSGLNESDLELIKERARIAGRAMEEYLLRQPNVNSPSLKQRIQIGEEFQAKTRLLQESGDDSSFRVGTYTVDRQRIAKSHLKQALEFLAADDGNDISRQLNAILQLLGEESSQVNDKLGSTPASALGRRTHQRLAAIDRLPRFYWATKAGTSEEFFLENPSKDPLENLIRSLDSSDGGAKWYRYQAQFGWDEKHFIDAIGDSDAVSQFHWGTREIAGERNGRGPDVRHVLMHDAAELWKPLTLTLPNYILASRHEFWWGDNSDHSKHLVGSGIPPAMADYQQLPAATFDGELCEVVQSTARQEMLFVSKVTGLLRGYVLIDPKGYSDEFYKSEKVAEITGVKFASQREYTNWTLENESEISGQQKAELARTWSLACDWSASTASLLVRFRDYREIAPGIMWPFREDRVQGAMRNGKYECTRVYDQVQEVTINKELTEKVNSLRPKDGELIQDQRFHEVVDYQFSNARGEPDILKLVDEKHERRMQDQLFIEGKAKPYEAMIGKKAPTLPGASNANWIGGTPPELNGQPYLIRFWATWCSPCKDDVPELRQLVNSGATIIGMHPKADANEVLSDAKESNLMHPTYVSDTNSVWHNHSIAKYPSPMFPYYLLVDAEGIVAAHGLLSDKESDLVAKCRELSVGAPQANQPSPRTDASTVNEQPKQPVVAPAEVSDEPELMDVVIRVNYKNRPVVGAMVHPTWYGGGGGNELTNVEPKLTETAGTATFRLTKRYGENFATESFHVGVRHADFCYRYEHNAPIENGVITISLTKGYRVLVDAMDAETKAAITSDIHAGDLRNGLWRRQSDGRLLSPMFRYDLTGNRFLDSTQFRAISLTHIRGEQVIGFSDLVPVRPLQKQRKVVAAKIPIYRPVQLSGELDSRVPRPVRKGRVMVVVERVQKNKTGKVTSRGPDWVDWTPIRSDGSFLFDALPRAGEVSLLATCDDKFVSSSTAVAGIGGGVTPGMFLGYLQPTKIQLGSDNMNVNVVMRPMTSARVRLLDPQSQPIVGAKVTARSHHTWSSSLGQPLFQSLRSRDMLLGRDPGAIYRESANGITDEKGIATLSKLIPGSYMVTVQHSALEMRPNPSTPHVRDVDVRFPGGKVNRLTIRLVPKGTTQLGR